MQLVEGSSKYQEYPIVHIDGHQIHSMWKLILYGMTQCQLYRSLAISNRTGIEQRFLRIWQDVIIANTTEEDLQLE